MLETNPMPQEKLVARDMLQENDPDTERVGWLRYHLLVHCFLYILPFYVCFSLCWQLGCILVAPLIPASPGEPKR